MKNNAVSSVQHKLEPSSSTLTMVEVVDEEAYNRKTGYSIPETPKLPRRIITERFATSNLLRFDTSGKFQLNLYLKSPKIC